MTWWGDWGLCDLFFEGVANSLRLRGVHVFTNENNLFFSTFTCTRWDCINCPLIRYRMTSINQPTKSSPSLFCQS